ncbi:macrolide family glycosyltransferase [Streptacidiphilus sp. EB129]|uniref:macrolide family glycosyltransferase n=1 Tax=Streptacidiphilus sp. EB129 TaxID=3156262 RepID=UPI00351924F5
MSHVLIFAFSDFGHFAPTLAVSRLLVERGHRVSYVLDEATRPVVEAVGARLVGYPAARSRLSGGASVDSNELHEVGLSFLADSTRMVLPAAREAFADDLPDLILYDYESFVAARTLARDWDRPTLQYFPYVASNEKYSLHAEVFDADSPEVDRAVEAVFEALSGIEPDEERVWAMMAAHDEHNLVFLPREFQPAGDTFDERYTFVGHCVPDTPPGVEWAPPAGADRVVLISLGTESNERAGFFRTCAEAFADGGWHAVMTLGRGNTAHDIPAAANLEAHEWLPHTAVLPSADVLVCHGGMGSIIEALYFRRPVVVVPHTPEHTVNGRRIAELGLGALLEGELNAESLRSVVERVTGDEGIRERVARMSEAIRAGGGAPRAADEVEHFLSKN